MDIIINYKDYNRGKKNEHLHGRGSECFSFDNYVKAILGFSVGIIVMAVIFFGASAIKSDASSSENYTKMYGSVRINLNDNMYSIAKNFYSDIHYSGIEDYLKEVCRINHITDRSDLRAGDYIIMPYYRATETYTDISCD